MVDVSRPRGRQTVCSRARFGDMAGATERTSRDRHSLRAIPRGMGFHRQAVLASGQRHSPVLLRQRAAGSSLGALTNTLFAFSRFSKGACRGARRDAKTELAERLSFGIA